MSAVQFLIFGKIIFILFNGRKTLGLGGILQSEEYINRSGYCNRCGKVKGISPAVSYGSLRSQNPPYTSAEVMRGIPNTEER